MILYQCIYILIHMIVFSPQLKSARRAVTEDEEDFKTL